jgi:hypothetical protein
LPVIFDIHSPSFCKESTFLTPSSALVLYMYR